jgi:D-glycero-D-manno-heptose 1,7-bisphosphate phosphatase
MPSQISFAALAPARMASWWLRASEHRQDALIGYVQSVGRGVQHMLSPARGAVDGLRRLQEAGYLPIVTTNQSGVARGFFQETELVTFNEHMVTMFAEQGVRIDGVYYCPHHAEGVVPGYSFRRDCRKPAPGMLLRAARDFGVDLAQSWMIGDSPDDVGAGRAAGCKVVFLAAGDIAGDEGFRPGFVAEDM